MAKIFRKIRQKMLSANNLKNYLIYALGEILLVVIGILCALQINAMNQNRKRADLEKTLLKQVRFELLESYEDILRDSENLKLGEKAYVTVSDYISDDKSYDESLCFDFYWLQVDEYIYPASSAYDRIEEVGLDIIMKDSIRNNLQTLYEGHFPRLTKINSSTPDISASFSEYYLNSFHPNSDSALIFEFALPNDTVGSRVFSDIHYRFPKDEGPYNVQRTIGYVPLDFADLKKDSKFHMLLERTRRYRNNKLRRYATIKTIIKEVIIQIETELNR